jgi:hypothetical protein
MDMKNLPDFLSDMDAVLKHEASWLNGSPPDYSKVNELYLKERVKTHAKGSIEDMITNLMKNWEKELTYKSNPEQWVTTTADQFRMSVNGPPMKALGELAAVGPYNAFIGDTEYYCASKVKDPQQANRIFRTALSSGFAWECLEVYSKPPNVTFKWRHWGNMDGELQCPMRNGGEIKAKAHGKRVEIFGITTMILNDKFQILDMEHFFRPDHLVEQMIQK